MMGTKERLGYRVFSQKDDKGIDRFYEEFKRSQIPAVWLESKRNYVNLYWDLAGLPPAYDDLYREEVERVFMERVQRAFQVSRILSSKILSLSFFNGTALNLSPDQAQHIAKLIFKILGAGAYRTIWLKKRLVIDADIIRYQIRRYNSMPLEAV